MRRRTVLALGVLALAGACGISAPPHLSDISFLVPGFDGWGEAVARELRALIDRFRWARRVQIRTHGDGCATLAGFVAGGRPGELLVGDAALLGAAALGRATSLVGRTAPLARLVGEWEVLAAPADSRFRTFDQFAAALQRDPSEPRVAGGVTGGPDHVLYGLTAQGLGADPRLINYLSYQDRAQVIAAMLDGRAAVGVGSRRDLTPHIRAGRLRPLAVSSPERMTGVDAPTLLESGVRLIYANWSGLLAVQGLSEGERAALLGLCRALVDTPGWRRACVRNGWAPMYLDGDDFREWLADETGRTRKVLGDLPVD